MARVIQHLEDLRGLVGHEVAVSDWIDVSQQRIERFAEATGDRQWIHVDAERAARESPFGGPVAHGFLTLSLVAPLMASALEVKNVRMAVNYGLNRVRFPAPVRSGRRVRASFTLQEFQPIEGGAQLTWQASVAEEAADKPCCVAELVARCYA